MSKKLSLLTLTLTLLLAACVAPAGPRSLTVMTHNSFTVTDSVLKEFESANNVTVTVLKSGDAGMMLNIAILNKSAPLADVLYGVDNTLLSRALDEELFEAYDAPALAEIPAALKLDDENRALPVDYGDVCLNYDKAYFAEKGLPPPGGLTDLTRPEYKGLTVVEDPATSSPGLAFVLAAWSAFGDEGFGDYWAAMRENDVKVAADWETAYYTDFSGSSGKGPRPIVVSYASSPPAEVFFASQPLSDSPTASVASAGSCFRQIEFVGILKDTKNRGLAEKWIDFMLSKTFQEDMPLNMFVYPALPSATLPDVFVKYTPTVESPVSLSPQIIADKREALIREWTEIVVK
ncbi:MAG: thiamine ABC transporter substrate-binding protein [Chloroflexi bacterium]|nr:thiamine ABC transporter substrate-binding protein [Chloroflexota bacterium]